MRRSAPPSDGSQHGKLGMNEVIMNVPRIASRPVPAITVTLILLSLGAAQAPRAAEASPQRAARGVEPQSLWVTDGNVNVLSATSQGLIAGGDFTLIGRVTGTWVNVHDDGA